MNLLGRFRCWLAGKHKRGERVGEPVTGKAKNGAVISLQRFACPRCGGNLHLRSVRAKAVDSPPTLSV